MHILISQCTNFSLDVTSIQLKKKHLQRKLHVYQQTIGKGETTRCMLNIPTVIVQHHRWKDRELIKFTETSTTCSNKTLEIWIMKLETQYFA